MVGLGFCCGFGYGFGRLIANDVVVTVCIATVFGI